VSPFSIVTYPSPESNIPYVNNQTGSPNITPMNYPFTGRREVLGDEDRSPALPGAIAPSLGWTDAGELVACTFWNRLEQLLGGCTVSPCEGCRLPYQVNIAGLYPVDPLVDANPPTATNSAPFFRNNMILYTANHSNPVSSQTFYNGWGRVDLSPAIGSFSIGAGDTRNYRQGKGYHTFPFLFPTGNAPPATFLPDLPFTFSFFNNLFTYYYGLPAIGVVMTEFYNASVSGYYGNTVPWQYIVNWCGGIALNGLNTSCPIPP